MAKYLVTGGAGFIGSHIVRRLVAQGDQVSVVDNFLTGSRSNLSGVLDKVELIEGDIRDAELMRDVMKGVEYCLHEAALPSVPRSVEDPATSNEINVDGTLNVFLAAKEAGVKRVVYASSSSVYGDSPTLPKHEELPTRPLSPYAITKLAGELYANAFHSLYGAPIVSLRYFNVFGPGQRPDSPYAAVIPIFLSLMTAGKPATIHGDGEQTRDFCYVDNVVSANLLACSAPAEEVSGRVFNVACEERHTINELVAGLNDLLGVNVEPVHTTPREGDVRDSLADITRARRHFGYDPAVKFAEGLDLTVKWFQEGAA
jgi:nucleoside-diphosphate-sugar epimerase